MTNVSVAGNPHKNTDSDWENNPLSLAQLAGHHGLDLCAGTWVCGGETCHHTAHRGQWLGHTEFCNTSPALHFLMFPQLLGIHI